MPYLPSLTDSELLAYAYQSADPLTTSDLEAELAKRLETALTYEGLVDAAQRYDLTPEHIATLGECLIVDADTTAQLLAVLSSEGIDTPTALRQITVDAQSLASLLDDYGFEDTDQLRKQLDLANSATELFSAPQFRALADTYTPTL